MHTHHSPQSSHPAPVAWSRAYSLSALRFFGWLGVAALVLAASSRAQEQSVLVINVDGPSYNGDGFALFEQVQQAGANATFVNLNAEGVVSETLRTNTFDQVWVFDLSHLDDNYPADWLAIADWYKANTNRPMICDARIISSLWGGRAPEEGRRVAANYYANLKRGGGGLMLGTDHNEYHSGINSINLHLGLVPFSGFYGGDVIPINRSSPLMTFPNDLGETLFDDSTTGYVPYGLQPNGLFLYPVAWHGGDRLTPGISTTIPSTSALRVTIQSPADATVINAGASVTFTAAASEGDAPYQYLWNSSLQGALPEGQSITVTNLNSGDHLVSVTALDASNRIAVATIHLTVRTNDTSLRVNIATAVEVWWDSAAGKSYQVQWAPEAQPADWQNLGAPVAGTGAAVSVFDSTRQNGRRFYRVVEQP